MKVLILNYEYPPLGGGAGYATQNIARELALLDQEVTVLTSRYGGGQPPDEVQSGVRIVRVRSWRRGIHDCGLRGAYSYFMGAYNRLRSIWPESGFDVLHYFFGLPTGGLLMLPGRHRRVPSVVSLRGSDVPYYDAHNPTIHRLSLALRPVIRKIWHRADRVVALSEGLRDTARRTDSDLPISVIPNGVETDLFRPAEPSDLHSEGPLRLVTVTRLVERKGLQHLLEAIALVRHEVDLRLVIAGTGNYEEDLRGLANELAVSDIVEFLGYQPRESLPELYRDSDLFVLPSMAESFGLVFAEAMSSGLPVIGGRTGGVPELLGDENGILVEPGDVDGLATAIRDLAEDPEHRQSMGIANRKRVVESYSWREVARKYLQIYREIRSEANGRETKT